MRRNHYRKPSLVEDFYMLLTKGVLYPDKIEGKQGETTKIDWETVGKNSVVKIH